MPRKSGAPVPPERWLVAAWPGLGEVATTAAVYLLSKLRMRQIAEFKARDLFELDSVDVNAGLLHASKLPRSRLFLGGGDDGGREIVVFLGEAQPPTGKLGLCQRLMEESRGLGVTRVFTFSAYATDMAPGEPSRTFGIASDEALRGELRRGGVEILSEGSIRGLNGVALAAAAEAGLPAAGLLGEMPSLAEQLPCPNAAAAVLRAFRELSGVPFDLGELEEYGRSAQAQVTEFYARLMGPLRDGAREEEPALEASAEARPDSDDAERVERLFREASGDRSKAFELKKELDRLGVFARYEDRFLNLFESGGRP